ncbi:MAG TPA: hypothetical protein VHE34_04015 [Puia sp.]|uniref:hypothetical protein n=1 Tax=Puia sp. TaxID=2045100 RepID=UPI002C608878|nr:hypothetical protein [Puia sp.]HVU94360.1 hypothetical protein [Puia sp.]
MRKCLPLAILAGALIACTPKKPLTAQLTTAFTNHLARIDSTITLDSVRIIWNVPVNERLARIIDDTVYVREYNRVKAQLAGAAAKNDRDSMAFYRYEIRVMEHEIDSISKAIGKGDTTHSYGSLVACAYYLKNKDRAIKDSTLLYIDSAGVMRYTGFMDSSIARTTRQLTTK